jgi:hypothetical protein
MILIKKVQYTISLLHDFLKIDTFYGRLKDWYDQKETDLFYKNDTANNVTRIWALILAIDFVISLSYTIFPKKEKQLTHSA